MTSNLHKLASLWIIYRLIFWRCLVVATQFLEFYSMWRNRILTMSIFLPGVWDCFLFPLLVIQFPLISLSFPFSRHPSYLIIGLADVVVTILIVYWNQNVSTHFRSLSTWCSIFWNPILAIMSMELNWCKWVGFVELVKSCGKIMRKWDHVAKFVGVSQQRSICRWWAESEMWHDRLHDICM